MALTGLSTFSYNSEVVDMTTNITPLKNGTAYRGVMADGSVLVLTIAHNVVSAFQRTGLQHRVKIEHGIFDPETEMIDIITTASDTSYTKGGPQDDADISDAVVALSTFVAANSTAIIEGQHR